jgi:hypothetical protein
MIASLIINKSASGMEEWKTYWQRMQVLINFDVHGLKYLSKSHSLGLFLLSLFSAPVSLIWMYLCEQRSHHLWLRRYRKTLLFKFFKTN